MRAKLKCTFKEESSVVTFFYCRRAKDDKYN